MDKLDLEVINILRELEMPPHVKGYEFIKTAIRYLQENPNAIYAITKELYPSVAKMHGENIKPSHVERGIRHSLSLMRADDAIICRILGRNGPFTNSEFLATLNESIRVKMVLEQ